MTDAVVKAARELLAKWDEVGGGRVDTHDAFALEPFWEALRTAIASPAPSERDAVIEECAMHIEQWAQFDDESDAGERICTAFNDVSFKESMNKRLLAHSNAVATEIRALKSPTAQPKGEQG